MVSAYLFNHPILACIVFILIGVVLGWILTTLFIEMFTDVRMKWENKRQGREITEMDEVPRMKEE